MSYLDRTGRSLTAARGAGRALRILISSIALIAMLAPPAHASKGVFHVSCDFSHAQKDDPIVFPGQPGVSHLHDFFGNVSTNASSSYRSMTRSGTTCSFSADTSGYWVPALLSPSGTVADPMGTVVEPKSMTAYYLARGDVQAPPKDLRMVAGGDTHNLKIAGYACGEGNATSSVPMDCGSGWLKGVIAFPSCWDGKHLDSADHRSHMTYPTGRGCPRAFPVMLPKIVFHITYGIHDGRGYTLASDMMMGMRHGMSLHADFWNTWNQSVLEQQVSNCLNAGHSCDLGD